MAGRSRDEIRRRTAETLALVHLEDKGDAFPHELSGGQKQRVALARGLVNKPRLLLLDEPLGALDAKLRERMQGELIALQREVGITFVFVTHAQQEALALSHRIAVMNEGRIEQLDVPDALYSAAEEPLRRRLHRQHQPDRRRSRRGDPPRPASGRAGPRRNRRAGARSGRRGQQRGAARSARSTCAFGRTQRTRRAQEPLRRRRRGIPLSSATSPSTRSRLDNGLAARGAGHQRRAGAGAVSTRSATG